MSLSSYKNTHFQNEAKYNTFLDFLVWMNFEWEYKIFFKSKFALSLALTESNGATGPFLELVLLCKQESDAACEANCELRATSTQISPSTAAREADLKMISISLYFMYFGAKDLFIDPICCNFCMVCPCVWGWFWPVLYIFFTRDQRDTWTLALQETRCIGVILWGPRVLS